jgi:uncharacterized membrane protein YeaQ/YmgE (transglycosylase-associated protein family)
MGAFYHVAKDALPGSPWRSNPFATVEELLPFSQGNAIGGKMSLFVWILLGLVSGFIASHVVNHRGEGIVLDVLLGIVGAIIGGWVFHLFGHIGVTGLNLYSILVATSGAVLFLFVYHMIRRHA